GAPAGGGTGPDHGADPHRHHPQRRASPPGDAADGTGGARVVLSYTHRPGEGPRRAAPRAASAPLRTSAWAPAPRRSRRPPPVSAPRAVSPPAAAGRSP